MAKIGTVRIDNFYSTPVATMTPAKTYTTESTAIFVGDVDSVAIQCFCTCGSTADNTTTFYFVSRAVGTAGHTSYTKWDLANNPYLTLNVSQEDSRTVASTFECDVSNIEWLKIAKIYNGKTAGGTNGNMTNLNATCVAWK